MKDKFKDTKGLDNAYMSLAKHYDERKENAIRQVKDGAFIDLLNQEIEELQKAKAIEEMANVIKEQELLIFKECKENYEKSKGKSCKACKYDKYKGNECKINYLAEKLYEQGYRKIDKDSVIIPKSEHEKLTLLAKECIDWRGKNCNTAMPQKEDSVVLSREEYKELKHYENEMYRLQGVVDQLTNKGWDILDEKEEKIRKVERKETAEKIYYKAEKKAHFKDGGYYDKDRYYLDMEDLKEILKQFGVEIKE